VDKPYVAYGSNLNAKDLRAVFEANGVDGALASHFVARRRVWLADRALRFSAFSKGRNGGVLDVVPAPGCTAPGVLFDVTSAAAWDALKHKEGNKYALEDVIALDAQGQPVDAVTYAVRDTDRMVFVPPAAEYAEVVAAGTRDHGLPPQFLEAALKDGKLHPLPLFVYGPLLRGEVRHHTVEHVVTALETAWGSGRLWDCGAFPGLEFNLDLGKDVVGELLTLPADAELWDTLDVDEVFKGHLRVDSLFRRVVVPVRTTTQAGVWAWTYVLNHVREDMPLLEDGDWRAWQRRR